MKKFLAVAIEINEASFPWYAAITALAAGTAYAYPSFIRELGISLPWIAGFMAASLLLKTFGLIKKIDDPRATARRTVARMKPTAFSVAGSAVIVWALTVYEGNRAVYRTFEAAGVRTAVSGAIFFVIYWCIVMSALRGAENGTEEEVETVPSAGRIKEIYAKRREYAEDRRLSERSPLRRYAHETEYAAIAAAIPAGTTVLDAGCGDGSLSILLAEKGAFVTACDISPENIAAARRRAAEKKTVPMPAFAVADAEALPFPDNSFDWVVSSHVLEHVPHFEKALEEIRRITKKHAVIAMPTCLNPCAAAILGGDTFWAISRWSTTAWLVGLMRIILNLGADGVDEKYAGDARLPHVWHYPWVMRRKIKNGGFHIRSFEASSLCLPYFRALLPIARKLERYKKLPLIRNFGYGSIAVVEK